jgi:hypothetical protein
MTGARFAGRRVGRIRRAGLALCGLAALVWAYAGGTGQALAQGGPRGGGPPGPPPSPQASAPIDVTGYWVAIVNEDWRWRMVTPPKGDYPGLPLNAAARKVADAWDPSMDGRCEAYGAIGVMRMPTRLHITWENERTLRLDTDAGQQTRRLHFDTAVKPPSAATLQGHSLAEWERPAAGRGGGRFAGPAPADGRGAPPAAGDGRGAPGAGARGRGAAPPGGSLKVVTTRLQSGWLRRNGVPYSANATLTEYFDRFAAPNGDEWLVVTAIVADPTYLTGELVTSTHFKREPDGAKWSPAPCRAR